MSARHGTTSRMQSTLSRREAEGWRRFLTKAPPLDTLIEIRRLHDNKTILRRRSDLPAAFSSRDAEWRSV